MKPIKFYIEEYLDDVEMVQEYLNTVLEEGNAQEIIVAYPSEELHLDVPCYIS